MSLFHSLFKRSTLNRELDEEIRAHIQHRADDLERSGLDRSEAERHARVEFGGEEKFVEECYEALGANFLDTSIHDAGLAFASCANRLGLQSRRY